MRHLTLIVLSIAGLTLALAASEQVVTVQSGGTVTIRAISPDSIRFDQQQPVASVFPPNGQVSYILFRNWSSGAIEAVGLRFYNSTLFTSAVATRPYTPAHAYATQDFPAWIAAQSVPPDLNPATATFAPPAHGTATAQLDAEVPADPGIGPLSELNSTNAHPGPRVTYTPAPGFVGEDLCSFTYTSSNGNTVAIIKFVVPNRKPTLSLQASPQKLAPGGTAAFIPTATDADGHAVTLAYDYGDGTTGTEAFKTYSTPGTYTVTVSANDGFDTVTAQIQVEVVGDAARVPVPRFTTSDVVGFVGVPLAFDAAFSTDPQNSIVSYSWNFGDNSPTGSGQVVSRTYTAEGSYLVTLTIVDGEGIQASTARAIEILPAELLGTFNAGVEFSTLFDRTKTSKDTLSLKATLNLGDALAGDGTAVALTVAGQTFNAQLDRKLRASVNEEGQPRQTWKVKFGVRKQAAGQIDLQVTIKNAPLGLGFNQLGAVPDNDDLVDTVVPIAITVGSKSFEITTDATFKFNKTGTRAKGEGQSE